MLILFVVVIIVYSLIIVSLYSHVNYYCFYRNFVINPILVSQCYYRLLAFLTHLIVFILLITNVVIHSIDGVVVAIHLVLATLL